MQNGEFLQSREIPKKCRQEIQGFEAGIGHGVRDAWVLRFAREIVEESSMERIDGEVLDRSSEL